MQIVRASLLLTFAAFLAAGCEEDTIGTSQGKIDLDQTLDFGDVPIGLLVEREIEVRNTGNGVLMIEEIKADAAFSTSEHKFHVDTDVFNIPASSSKTIRVKFEPFVASELPVEATFTVSGDGQSGTVRLIGRGVDGALKVEPNPVQFGNVLLGATDVIDVKITNMTSVALPVLSPGPAGGAPVLMESSGMGRFVVMATVGGDGSILGALGDLAAGETVTIPVSYTPDFDSVDRADLARWEISYCGSALCAQQIRLEGGGTSSALECLPAMVEFGAVNPGRTVSRPITCTNQANDSIDISGWVIETGGAAEFSVQSFSPLSVAAGASFTIDTTFAPTLLTMLGTPLSAIVTIRGISPLGTPIDAIQIPLTGSAGGPTINVTPDRLLFGNVAIGTTVTKRLLVANDGFDPLAVTAVNPDAAMTGAYNATPTAFVLAAGTSTVIEVTFTPSIEGPINSSLVISSNDGAKPEFTVTLEGIGVRLPPCSYTLGPNPVNFGLTTVNQTETIGVRFENTGSDACLINDVEILDGALPSTSYRLVNGNETGLVLTPGQVKDFPIEFRPTMPGSFTADLTFYVSDPGNPNPRIPLFGTGEATTEITCPSNTTTPAGRPINLTVVAMTRGTMITSYSWSIVMAPPGGTTTPGLWLPDPPNTATVQFNPIIVGDYDIHITILDDAGGSYSCDFTVSAQSHGLRVEQTWDGSGDVDLHLINSITLPWFATPQDCYYGNRTPIWDPASPPSLGGNPELDVDNTSANGPENIRVDVPVVGLEYTIGVHNFARSAGRTVTINIFCGGVTTPTQTFVSRPLLGALGGNCTGNDFWKVASVVFSSQSNCLVTPIDTYSASQDRCAAY